MLQLLLNGLAMGAIYALIALGMLQIFNAVRIVKATIAAHGEEEGATDQRQPGNQGKKGETRRLARTTETCSMYRVDVSSRRGTE